MDRTLADPQAASYLPKVPAETGFRMTYRGATLRFRYIDDDRKEVGVPDVPALVSLIRARTIRGDTVLHDVAVGRWTAAAQHDVFVAVGSDDDQSSTAGETAPSSQVQDAPEGASSSEPVAPYVPSSGELGRNQLIENRLKWVGFGSAVSALLVFLIDAALFVTNASDVPFLLLLLVVPTVLSGLLYLLDHWWWAFPIGLWLLFVGVGLSLGGLWAGLRSLVLVLASLGLVVLPFVRLGLRRSNPEGRPLDR